MSSVADVYEHFHDALVSLGESEPMLLTPSWYTMRRYQDTDIEFCGHRLNRAESFACIAMFDSRIFELRPDGLREIIALASGNSLYVAASLLQDPYQSRGFCDEDGIKSIVGNVGRAGIALLYSPGNPRTRRLDSENWDVINYVNFDGTSEEFFHSTSVHLSFTGFEMSADTKSRGKQDTENFLLESTVSAHDRGI